MQSTDTYKKTFNRYTEKHLRRDEPRQLYEPMRYIMGLGGKRLRPVLTLMACDALGGNYKNALPAALALELFHNFSLVHDDIMDSAPLRRGNSTVHEKWDVNTAILSGDAMLIQSYQLFEHYDATLFRELLILFSQTALEVCEGQQYDVDFETSDNVRIDDYLHMIRCKTAVLLAACLKTGAMVARATEEAQQSFYAFGIALGMAFQLQDDYLDTFGDPRSFGKKSGGDIVANKKTYLYLKSLELSDEQGRKELEHLFSVRPRETDAKIQTVSEIYRNSGAERATRDAIAFYTDQAFRELNSLPLKEGALAHLRSLGEMMKVRKD